MEGPGKLGGGTARGSYKTGEETRQKLIDAALLLFGRRGFDGSGTREICGQAKVAVPAIAYHFGSKEGLYLACAEHVVERYRSRMGGALSTMHQARAAMAPDDARIALGSIIRLLVGMIRDAHEGEPWLAFMLREMTHPGRAYDLLYRDLWSPGLSLVSALIASARGTDQPTAADRVDALLLLSSLSTLATARRIALAFTGWPVIGELQATEVEVRLQRWIDQL